MTFRDERDAQRHRIEALERELAAARAEADQLRGERDRAVRGIAPPSPHPAGTAVYVEWNGSWWDAHVLAVVGTNAWRVHYDGWASRWDEIVGPDRIRPRTAPPPGRYVGRGRAGGPLLALLALVAAIAIGVGLVLASRSTPAAPAQHLPVASASELQVGQDVWIEWNGSWYLGTVVAIESPSMVRVHYTGFDAQSDESVPLARVSIH